MSLPSPAQEEGTYTAERRMRLHFKINRLVMQKAYETFQVLNSRDMENYSHAVIYFFSPNESTDPKGNYSR